MAGGRMRTRSDVNRSTRGSTGRTSRASRGSSGASRVRTQHHRDNDEGSDTGSGSSSTDVPRRRSNRIRNLNNPHAQEIDTTTDIRMRLEEERFDLSDNASEDIAADDDEIEDRDEMELEEDTHEDGENNNTSLQVNATRDNPKTLEEMDAADLVATILLLTGRTLDSLRYLENLDDVPGVQLDEVLENPAANVPPPATLNFSIGNAQNDVLNQLRPPSPVISVRLTPDLQPDHPVTSVPRAASAMASTSTDANEQPTNNGQWILLGVSVGKWKKSCFEEISLNDGTSLTALLASLQLRRTSVGAVITYLESMDENEIYVGYGLSPHKVTLDGWDDDSNLVELGNLADVRQNGLSLQDIPPISNNLLIAFNNTSGRATVSRLYVLYLFNMPSENYENEEYVRDIVPTAIHATTRAPSRAPSQAHPVQARPVHEGGDTSQTVLDYLSMNYGTIKDKVVLMMAPRAQPLYRAAYLNVWQYRYAAEVCDLLGIAWGYNQRVCPAIIDDDDDVAIYPHDVALWLGIQPRHFQNLRSSFLKAVEALVQIENVKAICTLDKATEDLYDIFVYFIRKDFMGDVHSAGVAPPHVLQAVRTLSWEQFKKHSKALSATPYFVEA